MEMTVRPMVLLEGEPFVDPSAPEEVTVGCFACNMGRDEALAKPNCAGISLADLLDR